MPVPCRRMIEESPSNENHINIQSGACKSMELLGQSLVDCQPLLCLLCRHRRLDRTRTVERKFSLLCEWSLGTAAALCSRLCVMGSGALTGHVSAMRATMHNHSSKNCNPIEKKRFTLSQSTLLHFRIPNLHNFWLFCSFLPPSPTLSRRKNGPFSAAIEGRGVSCRTVHH